MATPKKKKEDLLKAGRPKTPYDPGYCELLIKHMSEGYSFETFGAHVNCSKDTLYRWRDEHPEFCEAKKQGESKARHWWEEKGAEGACGLIPNFNASVWIFSMKNKFGYRDTIDANIKSHHTERKELAIEDKSQEIVTRLLSFMEGKQEVHEIKEAKPIRLKVKSLKGAE